MMENHEKGPEMRSDRPGITTNVLPFEGSSHVLEREKRMERGLLVGFGAGEKGIFQYKSSPAYPTFLRTDGPSAVSRRTVRHPSILHSD